MVLAEHLEIDAKSCPAHAEVRLPLQLHVTARDGKRRVLAILVLERDGAILRIDMLHRNVEHAALVGEIGRKGE